MAATILDAIKGIASDKLGLDPDAISEDSTFEELGIDSLDAVVLIYDLEDAFGIDFGEPEGLTSVKDLVSYVEGLQKGEK